ncbi:hypothetical protein Tco_1244210 [Tanacetum coccineum]
MLAAGMHPSCDIPALKRQYFGRRPEGPGKLRSASRRLASLEFNMSRTNSQIVSEEQLVLRANRLVIKKNNQCVTSDSHITDTMLRFFGMEVPDAMISDAIKKKAGYKYYMAKKVESKKAKIVDKPEEQHVSPVKSGRGKGFNCYGDQVANVPNKLKKDVVPRKTKSLTIAEETDVEFNMSRTNSQAKIVSEEQLVPRANRLVIKKNNQRVASDSHITDTMLRFFVEILRHHKLYNPVSLTTTVSSIYLHQFWTTINHNKNNHTFTFELDNHTFTLTPGLLRTVLQLPPPDPNNTYIQPPLEIQILEFIKTLSYDEDPETKLIIVSKMVATRLHQPWRANLSVLNRYFASLIWDEFEWQIVERSSRPSKMSKLLYTRFTKFIIDYILSLNKSIPCRSDYKLHSSQDDHIITKLLNTTNGDYKFGMEVPDAMIIDAIKKKAGYTYYMAKKVESEKAKSVDKPDEQHVSLIKRGRGKGKLANSTSIQEPRSQRRRRSQLTIDSQTDKAIADMYNELGLKLKGPAIEDQAVLQKKQPVAGEGSSVAQNKYYSSTDTDSDATLYSSSSDESANETDDADESDMDLSDDNSHRDDDDARYRVFMHNKSTATPNSTYLSLTVTSSSLDFIQTLLDKTSVNELTNFMSHLVYTDAHTTPVVHNSEGNLELTSYILGASEVLRGTHVDVLTTKTLMQEMFLDENAHHIPSLPAKKIPYHTTTPQPSSLQAKAKKLIQKAKKNMRKFNFKKAIAQKFKEYDQKLEALTNFNVSKAFEKVVQAKVLTEIKKLLPPHIPNAIATYVKPRLNTSVLEVMKTNQINLFTQSSTSTDDLSEIDLKLKLLNRIHLNKSNDTYTTHQKLYDTIYESIILDQYALDAQAVQSSFHKRSHDNQDPLNNREGENKKKCRKDVVKPSSRSSRQNRSPIVIVQDDTPAMQPLDQADILIQKYSKPEWFPKKSGLAKRRTTWFNLFLKSDIDKDENDILGPSTIAIAKKFKELIHKDELSIVDPEGAGLERLKVQYKNDVELEYHVSQLKVVVLSEAHWNSDEGDVSKPRSFERHMSKSTKPHPSFYNNDNTYLVDLSTEVKYTTSITKHYTARYYKEGIEDRILERWSKEVRCYHFEALNGIHHWEENRIDFFKAGMSTVTKGNFFSDLRIKSVVRIDVKKKWGYDFLTSIIVRRSDDKEYEFSYADLPRLSVNDVEDIRTVIKNRVEDIELGVESYQRTLNLTKPTMFFEGIDQRIPFTMTTTHKGVENLIDMLSKSKLGGGNKRLKGRDWTDYDVNSSKEMLKKIDEILRHRDQLRRLRSMLEDVPRLLIPYFCKDFVIIP